MASRPFLMFTRANRIGNHERHILIVIFLENTHLSSQKLLPYSQNHHCQRCLTPSLANDHGIDDRGAHEAAHRLEARKVFDNIADDEIEDKKSYTRYAHHLARACWHGGRIMLRQTSPEAEGIFDFILELHKACNGRWESFRDHGTAQEDLDTWLEFAAMFLSGLGNYFVRTSNSLQNCPSGRAYLMLC